MHTCVQVAGAAPRPVPPVWGTGAREAESLCPLAGSDPQEWGFCRRAAPGLGSLLLPCRDQGKPRPRGAELTLGFPQNVIFCDFWFPERCGAGAPDPGPQRWAVPWHWGDFPAQKPNFPTQSTGRAKGGETGSQERGRRDPSSESCPGLQKGSRATRCETRDVLWRHFQDSKESSADCLLPTTVKKPGRNPIALSWQAAPRIQPSHL